MATTQQIPLVAARLTEFQKWFSQLSNEDAQWAIMNGKQAVLLCVAAITDRNKEDSTFVGPLLTFEVPATTEKFIVKDKFKVDIDEDAAVKIFYISNIFKEKFLSRVEEPFPGSTIYGRKLKNSLIDSKTVDEIRGHEKPEVTLTEIYAMMADQPQDEKSILLKNKGVNIFYMKDANDLLYVIHICWNGKGWIVGANLINSSMRWLIEDLILYHSCLNA